MLATFLIVGICSPVAGAGVSKLDNMAAAPATVVPNEERSR